MTHPFLLHRRKQRAAEAGPLLDALREAYQSLPPEHREAVRQELLQLQPRSTHQKDEQC